MKMFRLLVLVVAAMQVAAQGQVIQSSRQSSTSASQSWRGLLRSGWGPDDVDTLPIRVDLRRFLPTPQEQNGQNSCSAWAIAYAAFSCQISQQRQQPPSQSYGQFSPDFVYNSLAQDGGPVIPSDAIRWLREHGCSTRATMSVEHDKPRRAAILEAKTYRITADAEPRNLEDVKAYLSQGYPVILVVFLDDNFKSPSVGSNPYTWSGERKVDHLHSICAVGYDDSRKAVLIMNSSGTDWKTRGFCWVSYDEFEQFDSDHWCVKAHVFQVKPAVPMNAFMQKIRRRRKPDLQRKFQLRLDGAVYENDERVSIGGKVEHIVCSKDSLFALRADNTVIVRLDDCDDEQRRDNDPSPWGILMFGPLSGQKVNMIAGSAEHHLHSLTQSGIVYEYHYAYDRADNRKCSGKFGEWHPVSLPEAKSSQVVDLRLGEEDDVLYATTSLGEVYSRKPFDGEVMPAWSAAKLNDAAAE